MMTSGSSNHPWHSQLRQWRGLGMALVAVILAIAVLWSWRCSTAKETTLSDMIASRNTMRKQRDSLREKVEQYRNLLSRHKADKEQLIRDIADFRNQLDAIKQKTSGLERVRKALQRLEKSFERFRAAEERFLQEMEPYLEPLSKRRAHDGPSGHGGNA